MKFSIYSTSYPEPLYCAWWPPFLFQLLFESLLYSVINCSFPLNITCSYLHETRDILTCRKPEIYLAAAPTSISTPKNPHLPKSIKKAEQPVPMNRKCDRETRAWHTHASMANMSTFFSNSFSARSHLGYSPPISLFSPEILKPRPLHTVSIPAVVPFFLCQIPSLLTFLNSLFYTAIVLAHNTQDKLILIRKWASHNVHDCDYI